MVQNRIKVYARLKKEIKRNKELFQYEIEPGKESDVMTIYPEEAAKCGKRQYRFDKVFDTHCGQGELFDIIAKPVINGVLNGFNGTIFAYGPTGSGKTYSLTGSHRKYHRRGLIPRTIEYIFKSVPQGIQNHVIYISYLEIYNEVAYDLLNPKTNVSSLEELPRVVVLEDERGEAHFRNLSVRVVANEEEAMRLLFLGDTNRTIAETPMNDCSSRSHCIFTVHVTAYGEDSTTVRKSKLNLVDLAGSERLHKIDLNGITLHEAKYINLSLHYLEQVILALSESRRTHVPFRNSIMTFMLRDSISGNCMTAMLATIGITRCSIEEALTTCKFAQRVSMVKTNVVLNEEINPRYEIENLKREIAELKQRLLLREEKEDLSKGEIEDCKKSVKNYIAGSGQLKLDDLRKIKVYVRLLKEEVRKKSKNEALLAEAERKYKEIIKQKEEEISLLLNIYNDKENIALKDQSESTSIQEASKEVVAFNDFLSKPENQEGLQLYASLLNEKHKTAAEISSTLRGVQKRILKLKGEPNSSESLNRLKAEQVAYKEILVKLQNVQNEMECLKHGMELQKNKVLSKFKRCSSLMAISNNRIYENHVATVESGSGDYISAAQGNCDRGFNIHMKLSPTTLKNEAPCADGGFNINVQLSPTIHERLTGKASLDNSARRFYNNGNLSPRINESSVVKVASTSVDKRVFYGNENLNPTITGSSILKVSRKTLDNHDSNRTINGSPVVKVSRMLIDCGDKGLTVNGKLNPRFNKNRFPVNKVSSASLNSDDYKIPDFINSVHEDQISSTVSRGFPMPQLQNRGYKIPVAQFSSLDSVDKIPVAQFSSMDTIDRGYKIPVAQDRSYKMPLAPCISQPGSNKGFNINEKLDELLRECEQVENGFHQFRNPHTEFTAVKRYENNEISCMEEIQNFNEAEQQNLFDPGDSKEFKEFLRTIPLTGDCDIDEEIVKFYRTTFRK